MELEYYRDVAYRAHNFQFSVTDRELQRWGKKALKKEDLVMFQELPTAVLQWLSECIKLGLEEGPVVLEEDTWKL